MFKYSKQNIYLWWLVERLTDADRVSCMYLGCLEADFLQLFSHLSMADGSPVFWV